MSAGIAALLSRDCFVGTGLLLEIFDSLNLISASSKVWARVIPYVSGRKYKEMAARLVKTKNKVEEIFEQIKTLKIAIINLKKTFSLLVLVLTISRVFLLCRASKSDFPKLPRFFLYYSVSLRDIYLTIVLQNYEVYWGFFPKRSFFCESTKCMMNNFFPLKIIVF